MTDCVVPSVEVESVEDGAYDSDDSIIQAPWLLSYVKDTGRVDDKKEIENCLPFEAYCETELRGNTSSTDECDEMYENIGAMPQTELDTEDSEPAGNYPILKNPISSPEVTVSQSSNPFSSKRDRTPRTLRKMMERHRENERVRHRSLNEALKVLCKKVPGFRESDKDTKDPLDAWTSHNDPMSPRIIVNDVSLDDEPDADLQGICSPNSVLPQDGSKPQLYTAVISDSQTAIYDSPTRHLPYAPRVKKLQFSPNDTASIPDRVSLQDGNEILCYTEKQGRARPRKSKTPIKRLRVPPMSGPVKMERVLGVKKDTVKQQAVGQPCQREVEQQCDEGHGRFLYKQASDMYVSYVPYVNKLHNKAVTKRQRAKVAKGLATEKMPSEIKKRNEAMSPACTRPKVDNRRTSWMNGFMMFSQLNRRKFIRANPGVHTSHISKMMGHTWRTMTTQDKQPFRDQAKRYIEIMRKPGTELYDSCDGLSPDLFQRSDSRCSTTSSIFTDSSDSYTSVLSDSTTNILSQY